MLVAAPTGLFDAAPGGGGAYAAHPYPLGPELAGTPMRGIARKGSQLWFGCGRRLCVEDRGRVSVFGPAEGLPEDTWDALAITPDGSVWARSPSRLYRKPPGAARLVQEKPGYRIQHLLGRPGHRPGRVGDGSHRQGVGIRREGNVEPRQARGWGCAPQ